MGTLEVHSASVGDQLLIAKAIQVQEGDGSYILIYSRNTYQKIGNVQHVYYPLALFMGAG